MALNNCDAMLVTDTAMAHVLPDVAISELCVQLGTLRTSFAGHDGEPFLSVAALQSCIPFSPISL